RDDEKGCMDDEKGCMDDDGYGVRKKTNPVMPAKAGIPFLFVFFLLSIPAQAAESCYTPKEASAERLLRIHSELMVITVTCKTSSIGYELPRSYAGFTRRNAPRLKEAEATMKTHYEAIKKGQGVKELDRLRTRLANEIGQKVAQVGAPRFCQQKRDKVIRMQYLSPALIKQEAELAYDVGDTYKPLCSVSF
ncbi:MAG TPA: hypothetical protein DD400_03345, partial [Rhodospirillaceae bacterium]|nr:hypothetical protein [Rhodospirillaceae bacterium]